MPPSWARKAGVAEAVAALQQQLERDGMPLSSVRTYRRKLLAFPADKGPRPPAYGSFSRARCALLCSLQRGRSAGSRTVSSLQTRQATLTCGLKLLAFPADKEPRPPAYNSLSCSRSAVG